MRKILLTGLLVMAMVILGACSNNEGAAPATEEEVQESVQDFYNEMSKFEELGQTALADFNLALTSYSTGTATTDELAAAVDEFQGTTSDIANQVEDVKISSGLPDEIAGLLREAMIAFQSAYSIKEQASQSAVSPDVTAEEFDSLNQQADVAMLYGISKLNEARASVGLIEDEGTEADTGAADGAAEADATTGTDSQAETVPATVTGTESGTAD